METSRSRAHVVFALLSFASPFVAFLAIYLYQIYFFSPPTRSSGPGWEWSGAIYIIQAFLAIFFGFVVGLLLAIVSVWKRKRVVSFGTFAIIFNAIPILFFVLWWLKGIYV
jgi:hypothetical protein